MPPSRRIAVVSPFLDKRHGTERCVAEQIERLAHDHGYEIHIYSQRVEDVAGLCPSGAGCGEDGARVLWHRVPPAPGPGLVRYLWWFAANHLWRWWDTRVRGARYDLLYSPGINCLDADAVTVHIVFGEFRERVMPDLALGANPLTTWPRILHRRLYYRLIAALERKVYSRNELALAAISRKTARDVAGRSGRDADVSVIYHAVDATRFAPHVRERLRARARRELELPPDTFTILLVGNDWKNKGLRCLIEAAVRLRDSRVSVLIVGRDDRRPFEERLRSAGLEARARFLPVRPDVEFYYAAADAYAGPSLEDAFALPPLEAMACGLPVIVSRQAGVSEIVTDGVDGLILEDPRSPLELAGLIQRIIADADLRRRLGDHAARTARQYTWDRNAAETAAFLENAMTRRHQLGSLRH